jgi:hypothetical protein
MVDGGSGDRQAGVQCVMLAVVWRIFDVAAGRGCAAAAASARLREMRAGRAHEEAGWDENEASLCR